MFLRALVAFLLLPGVVAFLVPVAWLWISGAPPPTHPVGLIILLVGLGALLVCVRDFRVTGRGSLAPWAPPEKLVTIGLYRSSRNPMYVAVFLILLGWSATWDSPGLLVYAFGVAAIFHLRVVYGEEPALARRFGEEWDEYSGRVPRWFGRAKPPRTY